MVYFESSKKSKIVNLAPKSPKGDFYIRVKIRGRKIKIKSWQKQL